MRPSRGTNRHRPGLHGLVRLGGRTLSILDRRRLVAALVVAVTLVTLGVLMRPRPAEGQEWLGRLVERLVSNADRRVQVEGFSGSLPGSASVQRLTVADDQGVWLTAEGVDFVWRPLGLVGRRVEIERLTADRITVERLPQSTAPADTQTQPQVDQPILPELPVSLDLQTLRVDTLVLGESVLGGPAVLSVEGDLRYVGARVSGRLDIDRRDGPPGSARAVIDLAPAEDRFALDLRVEEPTGGIIVDALGLPEGTPVTVTAAGAGPLSAWRGDVSARIGALAEADGTATIALEDGGVTRATIDVTADLQRLLPAPADVLVGAQARFAGTVRVGPGGRVSLDPLQLTLAGGTATLAGAIEPAADRIDLRLVVSASGQGPLGGLIAGTVPDDARLGDVVLTGTLAGPLRQPTLSADLSLTGLAAAGNAAERLAVSLRAAPILPFGQAPGITPIRADLAGSIAGLALSPDLPPAAGVLLGASPSVAATLVIEPGLEGIPLSVGVPAVRIESAGVSMSGEALWRDGMLTSDLRLLVPELGTAARAQSVPLSGSASLDISVRGPPDALTVIGTAAAPELVVADVPVGPAQMTVTAVLSPEIAGSLRAVATPRSVPIELVTDFRLSRIDGSPDDAPPLLRLSGLALTALPGSPDVAELSGEVAFMLDPLLAEGQLEVRVRRFEALAPLLAPQVLAPGTVGDLGGSAELRLTLSHPMGRQQARVRVGGSGLRLPGHVAVGHVLAQGAISDAFGTPSFDLRAEAGDIALSGQPIDSVAATLAGSLQDLRLTADLRAPAGDVLPAPARVDVAANLVRSGETTRVRLTRLNGELAELDLRLRRPAEILISRRGGRIDGLVLSGDVGTLAVTAGTEAGRLSGTVRLDDVPLGLVTALVPTAPGLGGQADAVLELAGTLGDPRLSLRAETHGATVATPIGEGPLPVALRVNADLASGRLRAESRLSTPDRRVDLTGSVALPVRLDAAAGAVTVPGSARLDARLQGRIDLALLNETVAAGGDRISGAVVLDLTADGSLETPRYGGSARIDNASYRYQQLNAVVRRINGTLVGTGDRIVVQDLRGRTSGGGTIVVSGALRPLAAGGPAVDLRLVADDAQVARTDLVTATADAEIRLVGSTERLLLDGAATIDRLEFTIPDRLPAGIADLEVREVNQPQGLIGRIPIPQRRPSFIAATARPTPPPSAAPAAPPAPPLAERILLDLRVSANNRLFVRGRGLEAELRGDVRVGGTAARPAVTGGLSLVRGRFDVAARTLTFDRANVQFDDDGDLIPVLDIAAVARTQTVTAAITVTGEATSPEFQLTSAPELPREEILARVLFDKPFNQLSAFEVAELAQSAATLAGVGIGSGPGVLEQLRRGIGLDRLSIEGGRNGEGGGVEAGRYVSDRVFVGVEQSFDGESRARVEIDVTDRISLESDVGARGDAGIGVNFQWDY